MQKCISAGRSPDDESVIELSVKLASLYAMTSRDKEAAAGFKYCVDIMEKKVKDAGGILEADTNTLALHGVSLQSTYIHTIESWRVILVTVYLLLQRFHMVPSQTCVYSVFHNSSTWSPELKAICSCALILRQLLRLSCLFQYSSFVYYMSLLYIFGFSTDEHDFINRHLLCFDKKLIK